MKTILSSIFILLSAAFVSAQGIPSSATGIDLYQSGNYQKAAEELEGLVSAVKTDGLAWLYLGASYVHLGKRKEATQSFRMAKIIVQDSRGARDKNLKVLRKPHAPYTDEARHNAVTGTVKVAVEFKADGTIGFVFPFESLRYGLTDNCIRAAKSISFEPAIKDGKPIDVVTVISYSFSIY